MKNITMLQAATATQAMANTGTGPTAAISGMANRVSLSTLSRLRILAGMPARFGVGCAGLKEISS
jgi:hypothetical protein